MASERFRLSLDKDMLPKVIGYYIYRSHETHSERPILDGLYVQRIQFSIRPPEEISVTLEWSTEEE